jgi:hypothetical protein
MRPSVIVAGEDLQALLRLAMEIGPATISPTIVEASSPVQSLLRRPIAADAAVVYLDGSENVADLRELLTAYADTRFVLLAPTHPPPAALARVAGEHGSVFLRRSESSMVIAATLVAMLSPVDRAVS